MTAQMDNDPDGFVENAADKLGILPPRQNRHEELQGIHRNPATRKQAPGEETSNAPIGRAPTKPELPRNQNAGGLLRQKKTPATGSAIARRRHGSPGALRLSDTHAAMRSVSSAITVSVFTLIAGLAMFNTLAMIVLGLVISVSPALEFLF